MNNPLHLRLAKRIHGKVYYGWVIVGVVLISNLITFQANPTFGLYVTRFEAEFGWSRSMITLAPTLGTLVGAFLAPIFGRLVDRFGVRPIIFFGGIIIAGCYISLSSLNSLLQFYLSYAVLFGVMTTAVGFLVSNVTITRWFVKRRGRAMAIVMMGASGGGALFVTVQSLLIHYYDWRVSYLAMGGFALLLVLLPSFFLMVDSPEELGLEHPDAGRGSGEDDQPLEEEFWTVREAIRTRAFWLSIIGIMLGTVVVGGFFSHAVPYMESIGFSRTLASTVWGSFFVTGVIAKFLWGFIIEWITVRWGMVVLYLGECVGLYLLMTARSKLDLFVYAVVTGLCHGPFLQLSNQVWGDYFGRKSIGGIYGTAQPAIVLSAAAGPLIGGIMFDTFGNYDIFLRFLVGMAFLAVIVFSFNAPPVKVRG